MERDVVNGPPSASKPCRSTSPVANALLDVIFVSLCTALGQGCLAVVSLFLVCNHFCDYSIGAVQSRVP